MICAENIRVNHMERPIGIDNRNLYISWMVNNCLKQEAYRLVLKENETILFDSGKKETAAMNCKIDSVVPYKKKIDIELTVFDEEGQHTACSFFETGMDPKTIQAKWITPELEFPKQRGKAGYLKQTFTLEETTFARLYLSCHGLAKVYFNQKEVDDEEFLVGFSQVNKRLKLATLNVEKYLKKGSNTIEVVLGNGQYRGSLSNNLNIHCFGDDIALLAQLEVNGQKVLVSDENWLASEQGPLSDNDMMLGEVYDATKEDVQYRQKAKVLNFNNDNLMVNDTVAMRVQERFKGQWIQTANNEKVLDFGVNLVGIIEFDFEGKANQKLTLRFGETLDENGNFTMKNFENPKFASLGYQKIIYTCKEGHNHYKQTMCYFGFRYMKLESDFDIDASAFTACSVYSDMTQVGFFECDNKMVNQLFENTIRSIKGNFVDVPTDCPTREKSGYSGDGQAFVDNALVLMDCLPVYRKWIDEQISTQKNNGKVDQTAPTMAKAYIDRLAAGGVGWCDSMEIIPYQLYCYSNDPSLISERYSAIKKWIDFCIARAKKPVHLCNFKLTDLAHHRYLVDHDFLWGEWLEPDCEDKVSYMKELIFKGDPEIATSYLSYGCSLLAQMAKALGNEKDSLYYEKISRKAREAYRQAYFRDGQIKEEKRQCRYVRPIALNMLDEEEKKQTAGRLAEMVRKNDNHLNTGFLTTHYLPYVLTDYGQAKTAFDLLLQTSCPCWLYSVSKGATSIWENWKGIDEQGIPHDSFNHYSYGAVSGWLIKEVLGIQLHQGEITIHPHSDERLGYAKGQLLSPFGKIESSWKYDKGHCHYECVIPANMTAIVVYPDGKSQKVGPGTYQWQD